MHPVSSSFQVLSQVLLKVHMEVCVGLSVQAYYRRVQSGAQLDPSLLTLTLTKQRHAVMHIAAL